MCHNEVQLVDSSVGYRDSKTLLSELSNVSPVS